MMTTRQAQAARRWRRINAETRARGCRCGQPATHVRFHHGTVGGVPAETWSCADHVNANCWFGLEDGSMVPAEGDPGFDPAWSSRPFSADEVEADRAASTRGGPQAHSRDANAIQGILLASGPAVLFWLTVAALALILAGCGTASPEDRAREAWGNMPAEMRDDMCEALFLLGPVQTNEIIETLANDLPDEDVDALKRVMLEECSK